MKEKTSIQINNFYISTVYCFMNRLPEFCLSAHQLTYVNSLEIKIARSCHNYCCWVNVSFIKLVLLA